MLKQQLKCTEVPKYLDKAAVAWRTKGEHLIAHHAWKKMMEKYRTSRSADQGQDHPRPVTA